MVNRYLVLILNALVNAKRNESRRYSQIEMSEK